MGSVTAIIDTSLLVRARALAAAPEVEQATSEPAERYNVIDLARRRARLRSEQYAQSARAKVRAHYGNTNKGA